MATDEIDTSKLDKEIALPQLTGIRTVSSEAVAAGMTPAALATLLADARSFDDIDGYLRLAEDIEERDWHYRSVLSTRKLALQGLPALVRGDGEAADALRGVVEGDGFAGLVATLSDALGKGFAVSEIQWQLDKRWLPRGFAERDQRWFAFSKKDGRTLELRTDADKTRPLPAGKFIVHRPALKSGLPIRAGLAMPAAWAWLLKFIALKDWNSFIELYGKPVRIGKYRDVNDKKLISALRRALAQLGTDASAIIPEHFAIEFIKDATVSGTADAYEKLCRYLDEQISKLVLGQTLTADSGSQGSGSYALGRVHGDVRSDILRSDAKALSATLNRDFVKPFVDVNFGVPADGKYPRLELVVDEPEDVGAWMSNAQKAQEMGAQIPAAAVYAKLGIEPPAATDAVLTPPGAAALHRSGCPACGERKSAHGARDEIDTATERFIAESWQRVSEPLAKRLTTALRAGDKAEFEALLIDAAGADMSGLAKALAELSAGVVDG